MRGKEALIAPETEAIPMKKSNNSDRLILFKTILSVIVSCFIAIGATQGRHGDDQEKSSSETQKSEPVVKDLILVRAYTVDAAKGEEAPITYTLTKPARVRIIVSAQGDPDQLYRILIWEWQDPGPQTVMFDGKDQGGYPIDLSKCSFWVDFYDKEYYKPNTIELKPLTTQDLILGRQGPHNHNICFEDKCKPSQVRFVGFQNILPDPSDEIISIHEDITLSGVVNIKARVAKDARGYGDMTGYGVRWMVDETLIGAQYYEKECDGEFEFRLDTSAFPEGPHVLRVSCCDHYDHIGVYSVRVNFKETR